MLRNYLAENGLAPDTDDLNSKAGDVSSRVAQLENKLTESDQEAALNQKQQVEMHAESHSEKIESQKHFLTLYQW